MRDSHLLRPPRLRPALAFWLWERGYTWKQAGQLFGCTGEAVRLWCLPFDDPARRRPDDASLERIVTATSGAVGPATFIPPHLTPPPTHVRAAEDCQ